MTKLEKIQDQIEAVREKVADILNATERGFGPKGEYPPSVPVDAESLAHLYNVHASLLKAVDEAAEQIKIWRR